MACIPGPPLRGGARQDQRLRLSQLALRFEPGLVPAQGARSLKATIESSEPCFDLMLRPLQVYEPIRETAPGLECTPQSIRPTLGGQGAARSLDEETCLHLPCSSTALAGTPNFARPCHERKKWRECMGIEPTGHAVHATQPALKAGRHTSTDPLPLEWPSIVHADRGASTAQQLDACKNYAVEPRTTRPGRGASGLGHRDRGPRAVHRPNGGSCARRCSDLRSQR
jgi:hypothetical protein